MYSGSDWNTCWSEGCSAVDAWGSKHPSALSHRSVPSVSTITMRRLAAVLVLDQYAISLPTHSECALPGETSRT